MVPHLPGDLKSGTSKKKVKNNFETKTRVLLTNMSVSSALSSFTSDIIMHIQMFCDIYTVFNMSLVCRQWRHACLKRNDLYWKRVGRLFGLSVEASTAYNCFSFALAGSISTLDANGGCVKSLRWDQLLNTPFYLNFRIERLGVDAVKRMIAWWAQAHWNIDNCHDIEICSRDAPIYLLNLDDNDVHLVKIRFDENSFIGTIELLFSKDSDVICINRRGLSYSNWYGIVQSVTIKSYQVWIRNFMEILWKEQGAVVNVFSEEKCHTPNRPKSKLVEPSVNDLKAKKKKRRF